MKKVIALFVIFVFLSAFVSAAELPNPASVKCQEDGYKLDGRSMDDGSQYGVCIFKDSECGQWDYYRGDCKPGECKKVDAYWDCEEGCSPPDPCCEFKIKCVSKIEPKETGFRALLKKYFFLIFAWLWIEEEEKDKNSFEKEEDKSSFEKTLEEEPLEL